MVQVMRAEGDIRTGLSSPKRYLWADDDSWLEGGNWYMADPADRCRTGDLCGHAPGALPPLHPRGRPRLPPGARRAEGERVRRRGPAEAAPRPPHHDDRRPLRDALPGLQLRQLAGLPQQVGRERADPRNPHPHPQLSQRHDPRRAETLRGPGQQGHQHLRHDAGQEPARQARAEPGHRRGQRRAPHLHLERAADAGPGPAAVVLHLAAGPRPEEAQGGRGGRARRRRAGGPPPRPPRNPAPRRGPPPRRAADRRLRRRGQRNPHRLHGHRRRHHRPDDRQVQLRVEDRRLHPRPGPPPGRHLPGRRPIGQTPAGGHHRPPLRRRPGHGRRGRAVALRAGSAAEPRNPRPARQLHQPPLRPPGPGLPQQRQRRRHRAHLPHRSRHRRSRGRRVAAEGLRQGPRPRLLQRPAGTRPGLRPQPVRGRRLRRLRRAALRLLPPHHRARRPTWCCWPGCPRSSATSSSW